MLNKIWPFLIIISITFAFISGNIVSINNAIFKSSEDAINITLSILGTMCLWSGIMNIASHTTLIDKVSTMFNPLINLLFPDIKNNKKIKSEISMNITANFLGLGNAATPLGLKAINSLESINQKKGELSNSMKMLILINTASIQLIPTTILSIRYSLASNNPTKILFPVWCSTVFAAVSGIVVLKILMRKGKK